MMGRSVLCVLLALHLSYGQNQYRATFSMNGVKGSINFTPASDGSGEMTVTANGLDELTNFAITSFPAVFGQAMNSLEVCNNLGRTIRDITDAVMNSSQGLSVTENEIFHRGILATTSNLIVCATILPVNESVNTFRATFIGPIVGQIWIRAREQTSGLFVLADLAYSNAVSIDEMIPFALRTHAAGSIGGGDFENRCSTLTAARSLFPVTVGNGPNSSVKKSASFVSVMASSLDRYVSLVDPSDNLVACAALTAVDSKTVVSTISWDNIRGNIRMTQASPFDSTTTLVELTGVRETPATYHVHKFPVPQRLSTQDQRCSEASVSGHFNPYGVVITDSPPSGTGTEDQYEIGDLSGKYGELTAGSVLESFVDWNLPLFGVNSVVGRSVVIHYPNGSRWVCASIGYPSPVYTAVVNFKYPAYGFIYFQQETNQPWGDTSIFGEIANLNGLLSMDHNYHVHRDPVGADCASTGPHFDPASLAQSPDYLTSCNPLDPFQCEIGDLSRRHSGINIGSQLGQTNKFFVTDSYISLSGLYNIIGRSIVIHDENGAAPRYACANITRVHSTKVSTVYNTWIGSGNRTVAGSMEFTQLTEYDRAEVTSAVTGLNSQAGTYHIHVLPIDIELREEERCSLDSVQGHFDPFGIGGTPPPATLTFDKYEVGDLSGKYGNISGDDITLSGQLDNNLPFTTGVVSCAGRSVVIHRADASGTRWKCNTIELQPGDETGHVVTARAAFTTAQQITGFVDLRQVIYEDGYSTVTSILVRLFNNDLLPTFNHNWHIHIDPVLNQSSCDAAKGHYDPYQAVATSSNYSGLCNRYNPFACEVGDLSNKQMTYTIDGKRRLYVDEDVPLHTDRTVLGRSIVFHFLERGAARIACANIVPTSNAYTLAFASTATYDHYRFTSAVAKSLGIARYRVIVLHNVVIPIPGKGCSRVLVSIAGTVSTEKLNELLAGTSSDLRPYQPTNDCKSVLGVEILGLSSYTPNTASTAAVNMLTLLTSTLIIALIQKILH